MAVELDDGEFWLPAQFLTDDDLLVGGQNRTHRTKRIDDFSYGFGNLFGPFSDLSSPVESVMGSTETESDEDDYLTELTRKMAQSTIQDSSYSFENKKGRWVSGSPQSTLCSVMGSCACNHVSGRRSPNCCSKVSSPPIVNRKNSASWNLLSAAAEEVARMGMMEETLAFYSGNRRGGVEGLYLPPTKPSATAVYPKTQNMGSGFYPNNTPLNFQYLQATQFQQLKEQQMIKQAQQGNRFSGQMKNEYYQQMVQNQGPNGMSMDAWPTLQQSQKQQQPGSGMRALFLGDARSKMERTGTGVFLPRRYGTPTEARKKSGCSTVLLPDRVVQALNLNLESMESQPHPQNRGHGSFQTDYAAALKYRNNIPVAQQRHNRRPASGTNNQDLRLPQEWTY